MAQLNIDQYSVAAVPLQMLFDQTEVGVGTGFFWQTDNNLYLITNWHNLTGIDPFTGKHISEQTAAAASIAVAVAKVAATKASLEASSALFELGGTRSPSASANLARYWRDARTHTLHDATRWKLQHIGRYTLSGTLPPRHGQL